MTRADGLPPWAQATGAGVASACTRVYEMVMEEMDRRVRPLEARVAALESRGAADDADLAAVVHEMEATGEWRPWDWAQERGCSETELRRRLGDYLQRTR